ncbi:hypothetical protein SCHPADRAFT_158637 [Schizopora paradoxa]|uniref:Uncharacterized protein n=1 Tax=Schizopora paradoxa TaxID=27342 RepID=A0A0H2S7C7_9AGAM|nr:hypothetical protein SCHPADRAFT_158637 [Schizopora paradoxa]
MRVTLLTVALAFAHRAFATNDWTKACLGGSCSFDVEASRTSMGGSMQISGSQTSISDITPAAGWQILNCTDSTNSQTIRLVCTDESLGCQHIFQNGAKDTIVRLPQGCGNGPFVRVANHSISDDQSLPVDVTSKLMRRDGTTPQVHTLQIDDNFAQGSGQHGNVSFEIHAQGDFRVSGGSKQRKRQNGSGFGILNVNIPSQPVVPFNLNSTCPAADDTTQTQFMFGSVSLERAEFNTTIMLTSTGTVSPPNINSLSFSAPSDAIFMLASNFEASLQGSADGSFALGNEEFPTFSVAGVLDVAPAFSATGTASASALLLTNFIPETVFDISLINLQFTYPSNEPPAVANIPVPGLSFDLSALPVENSNTEFTVGAVLTLGVEVEAFLASDVVNLNTVYSFQSVISLDSTPTDDNNENAVLRRFQCT